MSFIKIRVMKDIGTFETKILRNVDEMFRLISPRFTMSERMWSPQIDVYEAPGEIVVLVELAGVKREHLHLEIGLRTLKISGVRKERAVTEQTRYRIAEIPYGYFERSLSFPVPVDADTASASYTDGLLRIAIAKLPLDKVHKVLIQKD